MKSCSCLCFLNCSCMSSLCLSPEKTSAKETPLRPRSFEIDFCVTGRRTEQNRDKEAQNREIRRAHPRLYGGHFGPPQTRFVRLSSKCSNLAGLLSTMATCPLFNVQIKFLPSLYSTVFGLMLRYMTIWKLNTLKLMFYLDFNQVLPLP